MNRIMCAAVALAVGLGAGAGCASLDEPLYPKLPDAATADALDLRPDAAVPDAPIGPDAGAAPDAHAAAATR
jgi:hypothetical protein